MDADRQVAHRHSHSQWTAEALDRTREAVATCLISRWGEAPNSDTVNPPGPPDRMFYRCQTAWPSERSCRASRTSVCFAFS